MKKNTTTPQERENDFAANLKLRLDGTPKWDDKTRILKSARFWRNVGVLATTLLFMNEAKETLRLQLGKIDETSKEIGAERQHQFLIAPAEKSTRKHF